MYLAYLAISLSINFAGRGFDLDEHGPGCGPGGRGPPGRDLFLPFCGEPIAVLRNTWVGVSEFLSDYRGRVRPFVLDDGRGR